MTRSGIPVHIYGCQDTTNAYNTGSPYWGLDKGVVNGLPVNVRPEDLDGIEGMSDITPLMLHLPANANVGDEDVLVFDGMAYHIAGSPSTWRVWYHGQVNHLEIPLTAAPSGIAPRDVITMAEEDEKKYSYFELKQAIKAADKDARLEMKVDYIIQKLEDPKSGCANCRDRLDTLEDQLLEYKTLGGIISKVGSVAWGVIGGAVTLIIGYVILHIMGVV